MKISPKQYAALLYEMTKDKEKALLAKATRSFIELLARNRALSLFPKIERVYKEFYNAREEVLDVTVTSAHELSHHALKALKDVLKEYNVECVTKIDPQVIGGVRVQAGDYLTDDTLKARLQQLTSNIAH